MKTWLFAHNLKNYVKTGDIVKAYDENIGSIGNAGGAWFAHLHLSVSEGLTPTELKSYITNWTKDKVTKYYSKPDCDSYRMFGTKMDDGNAGYDWLQWIGNGYHPGIDYNGFGGGNTDLGYKFKSPVDGEVIFAGNWGGGWGNVILINEETQMEKTYYIKSDLRNTLKKWDKDFDHEDPKDHEDMAGELEKYRGDVATERVKMNKAILDVQKVIGTMTREISDARDIITVQSSTIEDLEKALAEEQPSTLGYYLTKIWEIIKGYK